MDRFDFYRIRETLISLALFLLIVYLISFIVWVCQLFRLAKKKNTTQLWLILVLGIVFFFLMPIWAIVISCLGRDEEQEEDKKEES